MNFSQQINLAKKEILNLLEEDENLDLSDLVKKIDLGEEAIRLAYWFLIDEDKLFLDKNFNAKITR